jgi:PAS domain S-box-containing protein
MSGFKESSGSSNVAGPHAAPAHQSAGTALPALEPINILLVDDEPRNLVVLQTVLADPGYRLVCAETAEQALLALVNEEFALLILDVHMPGMSGFELAGLVKQRQKTASVPIIFLTAYYSADEHVLEGYGTGAVDYLHKPISPAILRSKVAVFADLYRKGRESARANRELLAEVDSRRRAEDQLRQLNDELELRVAERTEALLLRERELRTLADNTPDILGRFDRQLRFVYVNAAVEAATGRPRDAFQGRTMRELGMPAPLCDHWERAIHGVFESQEPLSLRFSDEGPQGLRHYAARLVPEFGAADEPDFVLAIIQDVTEQHRAEEALRRADRRKDEFLATLSHELRNPLAPIRTGLHLLRSSPQPGAATEVLNMLDRQFAHMVRLVDDLLNVSRITSDKLRLRKERVSLRSVAETALESSRPQIEASGQTLEVSLPDEPLWLDADPARLSQVITNLLTNAAKYTPRCGRIRLVAGRDGQRVFVRVSDTGIGIPPEMLREVFEMFTQVNRAPERSQDGLGIGLALAKKLVELHGGTIAADSPGPGGGSTFTLTLPRAEPARAPDAGLPRSGRDASQGARAVPHRRILVVDDNVDGAESLAKLLEISGHQARAAHRGTDALDAAHQFRPDIVFLDIGLPGMDGYEVARRFRQDPELRRAVLVAITGWGTEEDKRQSREAGFDMHLTKPVEVEAIESLLATIAPPAR